MPVDYHLPRCPESEVDAEVRDEHYPTRSQRTPDSAFEEAPKIHKRQK
jgi:hypothetical protein